MDGRDYKACKEGSHRATVTRSVCVKNKSGKPRGRARGPNYKPRVKKSPGSKGKRGRKSVFGPKPDDTPSGLTTWARSKGMPWGKVLRKLTKSGKPRKAPKKGSERKKPLFSRGKNAAAKKIAKFLSRRILAKRSA
jgi:hypothetical protein